MPGILAGPFSLNEHEGHLRVATSLQTSGFAIPLVEVGIVEGDIVEGDVVEPEAPADELAEVFVLDTDGDLDVVGQTGGFGHEGETIQGVRFVGDTAYVVTFLNTDPFWVIDLTDPAAPAVAGKLEIPGFSAYLHPVDDSRVVGFGPDGDNHTSARLFDVSDPTAPAVVDEIVLGDDSPVVWDHHAYVALDDGRFAVPVNTWPVVVDERCSPNPEPLPVGPPVEKPIDPGAGNGGDGSSAGGGSDAFPGVAPEQICEPVFEGGSAGVSVLGVDGDSFEVVDSQAVPSDGSLNAERVILAPDGGWLLLSWDRLVPADGGEPILLPADPSTNPPVIID
ncbi:hypothetical protein BH18ACT4_BH18ACT4_14280 [soil metagenome]